MTGFMLTGPGGKSVELAERVILGRNPDCDIVLTEGHPSRRHAQITTRDGAAWLEDLGSANGTFVNERPLKAPVQLRNGDRIRFDAEAWEFAVPVEAALGATVVRASPVAADQQTIVAKSAQGPPAAPRSWADPDLKEGQGTKLFAPQDLSNMLPQGAVGALTIDAPQLRIMSGKLAGTTLKLQASQATNIWDVGCDPGKDITIPDDGVSGFHAKIVNEGNRWKLIDQMSANGTFVNGAKSNISYLASGDRIRFGPIDCVFQLPATVEPPATSSNARPWIVASIAFVVTAAVLAIVLVS